MSELSSRLDQLTPLQRAAYALKETQNRLQRLQDQQHEPIAIVGMSCRFPGSANSPAAFWKLLENKTDAIVEVPPERWDVDKYYDPDPSAPGKMVTRWGGFIDNATKFDNHFFGMSEREAIVTDPQQRVLLELTWEAFEDAGLLSSELRGKQVGVFVGISTNEYLSNIIQSDSVGSAHSSIGNSSAASANRISYAFDFRGPSLAIDTACSSALFAIHNACNSLRFKESQVAIVAAANLLISPLTTINLTKAGVCSPDGKIRAFDADANGYVRGDGAGVLILKRLSDAMAAGDRIHACIIGSATNHNGSSNSLTAPRRESQEAAMQSACSMAHVKPETVSYVEAHATGTPIGDSIESAAINNVYCAGRTKDAPLTVGAVKTNIGHTEAVSGLASVVKVAMAIKHRRLPATLHFRTPHSSSVLGTAAIHIPIETESWNSDIPLTAAVNSSGFGGANAHILLREHVDKTSRADEIKPSAELLVVTARTESALRAYAAKLIDYLQGATDSWYDICWTAALKRESLEHRLVVLASSNVAAIKSLQAYVAGEADPCVFFGRPASTSIGGAPSKPLNAPRDYAEAFVRGETVNFNLHFTVKGKLVDLPHYIWQRKRLWIDPPSNSLSLPDSRANGQTSHTTGQANAREPMARPELNVAYKAPKDALEEWIAGQWSQVLGIKPIGTLDNFFELGGDSLQASGLLNRLQNASGESIPITALFDAQTVESLAEYLRSNYSNAVAKILSDATQTNGASSSNASASKQLPRMTRKRDSRPSKLSIQDMDDAAVEELLRRKLNQPQALRDQHG